MNLMEVFVREHEVWGFNGANNEILQFARLLCWDGGPMVQDNLIKVAAKFEGTCSSAMCFRYIVASLRFLQNSNGTAIFWHATRKGKRESVISCQAKLPLFLDN